MNLIFVGADYPGVDDGNTPLPRGADQVFDDMLVLYAQAGRRDAFERLVCRWRPRHLAHARRLLGSSDRAADAVQETWVNIFRSLCTLNDPARFPAWSYAILSRRCQDILRGTRRAMEEPLEVDIPCEPVTRQDDALDLRAGLRSLPNDQQAAVALFYLDGLTVVEISRALGVPTGTVKSRLFHARRALRHYYTGVPS